MLFTRKEKQKAVKAPPGMQLIALLDKSKIANEVAHHLGDLRQICDDHTLMWVDAKTDEEKIAVHWRYRIQIARAFFSFGGFEIGVHGVLLSFGGQFVTASFFLVVAAIILRVAARH